VIYLVGPLAVLLVFEMRQQEQEEGGMEEEEELEAAWMRVLGVEVSEFFGGVPVHM
jgi:hypothetical protein